MRHVRNRNVAYHRGRTFNPKSKLKERFSFVRITHSSKKQKRKNCDSKKAVAIPLKETNCKAAQSNYQYQKNTPSKLQTQSPMLNTS